MKTQKFNDVSKSFDKGFGACENIFGRLVACGDWNKTGYEPTQNGLSYPKNQVVLKFDVWSHPDFTWYGLKIKND